MLLMLLVPAIPGALAGLLAGSFDVGYYVWFLCVWAVIALVMIGPANKHNANDNTSGVVTLLEIARSLPESQRGKVCFVLFDLEEAGLIGSAAYRKAHKKRRTASSFSIWTVWETETISACFLRKS